MHILLPVLVALSAALPRPLYTDEEAAAFAIRAERLMERLGDKPAPPADFRSVLGELKIDHRRLRVAFPETRDVMLSDEYRLSDHFVLIHHPSGRVAIVRRPRQ